MKARFSTLCLQWAITAVMFGWCCIIAVVILGEESQALNLTVFEFFVIKAMGFCSAYATYKAGEWCYRKGLFPAVLSESIKRCNEEGEV